MGAGPGWGAVVRRLRRSELQHLSDRAARGHHGWLCARVGRPPSRSVVDVGRVVPSAVRPRRCDPVREEVHARLRGGRRGCGAGPRRGAGRGVPVQRSAVRPHAVRGAVVVSGKRLRQSDRQRQRHRLLPESVPPHQLGHGGVPSARALLRRRLQHPVRGNVLRRLRAGALSLHALPPLGGGLSPGAPGPLRTCRDRAERAAAGRLARLQLPELRQGQHAVAPHWADRRRALQSHRRPGQRPEPRPVRLLAAVGGRAHVLAHVVAQRAGVACPGVRLGRRAAASHQHRRIVGTARIPAVRVCSGVAGLARQRRISLPDHRLPDHRVPVRRGALSGRPGRPVPRLWAGLVRGHDAPRRAGVEWARVADADRPTAGAAARHRVAARLPGAELLRIARQQPSRPVRGLLFRFQLLRGQRLLLDPLRALSYIAACALLAACPGSRRPPPPLVPVALAPSSRDSAVAWSRTTLPRGPTMIRVRWRYEDERVKYAGRGSARIAPPDSLRFDYAGPLGLGSGAAVVIGDSVAWADPEKNFRSLVPAIPMLWAALGMVQPPAEDAEVFGVASPDTAGIKRIVWRFAQREDTLDYVATKGAPEAGWRGGWWGGGRGG